MTDAPNLTVQKLRLQRGWSQEQLAELSGLSTRTIQRLERGQNPSVETLKSVAAVFEIDFNELREPAMTTAANKEALALQQVQKIKSFYLHVTRYVIVLSMLGGLNVLFTPNRIWVVWVAIGWGVGLLLHGLTAFNRLPFLTGEWERHQVEKVLGRKL